MMMMVTMRTILECDAQKKRSRDMKVSEAVNKGRRCVEWE